jgi:fructokinase
MNEEELKLLKQLFSLDHLSDENACCWLMEQFNLKFLILTAGDEYSLILDPEDSSL